MKHLRLFLLILSCLILTKPVFAGEMVQLNEKVQAYLAMPEGSPEEKTPAVILVHEWWGLNDQVKGLANEFAANGFTAFAVDLYRGKETADAGEAHELMRGLPDDRAVEDLKAGVSYLSGLSQVDPKRIGVIGWCMGGGYALKLATEDPRIKAVVVYYGKVITNHEKLKAINGPVLGIFGEEDRGISADSVKDFEFHLNQLGKQAEIHIYPKAGHAFANPDNPNYREDDAKDAWEKTLNFLKANLS